MENRFLEILVNKVCSDLSESCVTFVLFYEFEALHIVENCSSEDNV